jgi:hypothetical protein
VQTEVTQLVPLPEIREARQHIFPSAGSLDWFVRRNRNGLIEAGAILLLTGRWFADPAKFDAFMLRAGGAAAHALTQRAAA